MKHLTADGTYATVLFPYLKRWPQNSTDGARCCKPAFQTSLQVSQEGSEEVLSTAQQSQTLSNAWLPLLTEAHVYAVPALQVFDLDWTWQDN